MTNHRHSKAVKLLSQLERIATWADSSVGIMAPPKGKKLWRKTIDTREVNFYFCFAMLLVSLYCPWIYCFVKSFVLVLIQDFIWSSKVKSANFDDVSLICLICLICKVWCVGIMLLEDACIGLQCSSWIRLHSKVSVNESVHEWGPSANVATLTAPKPTITERSYMSRHF